MGFEYWNLEGSFHFGLLNYTRSLQEYAMECEEYIEELQEKYSMCEGNYYLKDAQYIMREYQELQVEHGKVLGITEKYKTTITYQAELIKKMQQQVEDLQEQLAAYESSGPKIEKKRDSSGRFYSDKSKREKEKIAYEMVTKNCSYAQIGDKLGVTPDTAKQYAMNYKRWIDQYRGREVS